MTCKIYLSIYHESGVIAGKCVYKLHKAPCSDATHFPIYNTPFTIIFICGIVHENTFVFIIFVNFTVNTFKFALRPWPMSLKWEATYLTIKYYNVIV